MCVHWPQHLKLDFHALSKFLLCMSFPCPHLLLRLLFLNYTGTKAWAQHFYELQSCEYLFLWIQCVRAVVLGTGYITVRVRLIIASKDNLKSCLPFQGTGHVFVFPPSDTQPTCGLDCKANTVWESSLCRFLFSSSPSCFALPFQ